MLLYVIIASIINIFLIVIETKFLSNLTILGFIFIIYLFPIILNLILSLLVIFKKQVKLFYCFIFPTISLLAYIIIGLLLNSSNIWTSFIQKNTITSGEMYIKINNSLIEPSQMVFVVLLYFLVEYISIKIIETRVKKNGNN